MSLWFFLWLILSAALIYFLGWTLYILYRQKTAWKSFAKKHKLRYKSEQMLGSPELGGNIGEYTVNLFTGEHPTADARATRKLSAIEIQLLGKMPIGGGIASGDMVKVVHDLGFREEIRPKHDEWHETYIAASDNRAALEAYLTPERVSALTSLMKISSAWLILVFTEDAALLRFDTPDPLSSEEKLDKIIGRMIDVAKVLELAPGESGRLKAEKTKKPKKQAALDVTDDELEVGLELEDDQPEDPGEAPSESEKPSTEKS